MKDSSSPSTHDTVASDMIRDLLRADLELAFDFVNAAQFDHAAHQLHKALDKISDLEALRPGARPALALNATNHHPTNDQTSESDNHPIPDAA